MVLEESWNLIEEARGTLASHLGFLGQPKYLGSAFLSVGQARELMPDFTVDNSLERRSQIFSTLTGSPFDRLMKYEMKTYLPDLLVRQDKMSMAHSIENRVPFLDNEMVEGSFAIPDVHLQAGPTGKMGKLVLKQLAERVFGHPFAWRAKQGFGIPLREYFVHPEFQTYLLDVISPGIREFGLFDYQFFHSRFKQPEKMTSADLEASWIAIAFEVWRQQYFQNTQRWVM